MMRLRISWQEPIEIREEQSENSVIILLIQAVLNVLTELLPQCHQTLTLILLVKAHDVHEHLLVELVR